MLRMRAYHLLGSSLSKYTTAGAIIPRKIFVAQKSEKSLSVTFPSWKVKEWQSVRFDSIFYHIQWHHGITYSVSDLNMSILKWEAP